ncbi:unnamed protein product [Cladocopium goreaui]|uniref:PDZ domain-containing protein n=1 Tax=Cladocopium goreaui TaxID=2562237 RepID=A0A9P1D5P4_9DINO|nr:unnamed protein product [Cladocopium goreaui]CAI4003740.1 unnamed protein product [Cladocopium goreaui]
MPSNIPRHVFGELDFKHLHFRRQMQPCSLKGLMALSISEAGLPGLPKNRWFVLSFRALAWMAFYFLPLHCVSFSNLRGYCVYGNAPGNSSLVCWRTALGPGETFEMAEQTGFSRGRVFVATVLLPSLYFLLYVAFVSVYVGEEHEHLGFIFIYGVGHLVIIFVAENLGPPNYPPPLNPRYSQKMGPATLGVAVMGFFAVTTAYSVAKRFVGPWLGTLMPAMLGAYEIGCLLILERTFVREFVQEKSVRRAYHHSNQGIVVSAQICMVHGMAEGARLMLILADISQSTSDSDSTFLVPIVSGVVWNVIVRCGAVDRLLAIITRGRLGIPPLSNVSDLSRAFSAGGPRHGVVSCCSRPSCMGYLRRRGRSSG